MTLEEKIKRAKELRQSAMFGVADLEDKWASEVVSLYPTMKYNGELIKAGTRISFDGRLVKAAVDLWDTVENNPENAPALWEDIAYREGYRIIPETITVPAAFDKGECGWWKNALYRSKLEANVHNPEQYPAGWDLVK